MIALCLVVASDRGPQDGSSEKAKPVKGLAAWVVLVGPGGRLAKGVIRRFRGAVAEVAATFEKQTSHTVKIIAAAPGQIVASLKGGAPADVVDPASDIATPDVLNADAASGKQRSSTDDPATTSFAALHESGPGPQRRFAALPQSFRSRR